jgi:hypothetical protein
VASNDAEVVGKVLLARGNMTLMIPWKLEIIRRLESGESQREVMASCSMGSSAIYDLRKWKDHLQ